MQPEQSEQTSAVEVSSEAVNPAERLEHFKDRVQGRRSREDLLQSIRELREKDLAEFSLSESDLQDAVGIRFALLAPQERQDAVDLANEAIQEFKGLIREVLLEVERDPRLLQLIEKSFLPIVRALGNVTGDSGFLRSVPETDVLTDADRIALQSKMDEFAARFEQTGERLESRLKADPKYASLIAKMERFAGDKGDVSSLFSSRKSEKSRSTDSEQAVSRQADAPPERPQLIEMDAALVAIREYADDSGPGATELLHAKLRMAGADIEASQRAGALGESPDATKLVSIEGSPGRRLAARVLGLVQVLLLKAGEKRRKQLPVGVNSEEKREGEPETSGSAPADSVRQIMRGSFLEPIGNALLKAGKITTAREAQDFRDLGDALRGMEDSMRADVRGKSAPELFAMLMRLHSKEKGDALTAPYRKNIEQNPRLTAAFDKIRQLSPADLLLGLTSK